MKKPYDYRVLLKNLDTRVAVRKILSSGRSLEYKLDKLDELVENPTRSEEMTEEQEEHPAGIQSARCGVDVMAGVLPGTPEDEFTRRFYITSAEWHNAKGDEQAHLLTDLAGKANGYATYLMLQPDRLNWVKTEWIWF